MLQSLKPVALALAIASLALSMPAATAADKVTTIPVHFAKGTSASTVHGAVHGYDTINYTLGARAGQTMIVKLTGSQDAYFNIIAPGQQYAMEQARDTADASVVLPASGSYRIEVYQPRAQARRGKTSKFTLRFEIR